MEPHHATAWEAVADAIGDATAMVQGDVRRSWAEFDERASRLAGAMRAAGLGAGSKVGLLLYNSPEFMEGYFAALKIRAVPFNVNYRYVEAELAYLFDDAGAEALILHRSLTPNLGAALDDRPELALVLDVDDGGDEPHLRAQSYEDVVATSDPAPRIERDPADITMVYTGGTTGMPKGVMAPIGQGVVGLLEQIPPLLGEEPCATVEDAVALATRRHADGTSYTCIAGPPLMHNTAMGMAALPTLLFGGTLAFLAGRRFDPQELWDLAAAERASSIIVVGDAFSRPMLAALDERPERDLTSVTLIASSGAMFATEVKEGLLGHLPGAAILDLIAASEGTMGMSISVAGAIAPTGTFTPGPGVIVVDEDDRPIPPGSEQAGIVALPGGAAGYYNDEAKTAKTFKVIDGVRYTLPGDWGTVAADGTLSLLGRGSQCINTAGEKVFPEEVEEVVKALPAVEDCLVFGLPDERFGQRVAAVVSKVDASFGDDDLMATVREKLASYKVPREMLTVPVVPRMPSGKADYPAARALLEAHS